jgi:hypothetical protein
MTGGVVPGNGCTVGTLSKVSSQDFLALLASFGGGAS